MLMIKRALFGVLLLNACFSFKSFSQEADLAKIIPPSPILAPYQRYGDYPVNHSTGMTQISIPLYNIKIKDFTFPIDISFRASGRRAGYDLSTMGVGWVLNATGYISREIRDRPDELASPGMEVSIADIGYTNGVYDPLKLYNALIPADITIQADSEPGINFYRDAENDIFSYNVNGMSGKYILDDSQNAIPLTSVPYHINGYSSITDEKGVKYEFGKTGNEAESIEIEHHGAPYWIRTGFYLSKITLPSGEIITFNYGTRNTRSSSTDNITSYAASSLLTYSHVIYNAFLHVPHDANMAKYATELEGPHVTNVDNNGRNYNIKFLTSIEFGNGRVVFNYDMNNLRLTGMEVTGGSGTNVKKFDFSYAQTPGTIGYLPNNNSVSLSEISIKDKNNLQVDRYRFDYYNYTLPYSDNFQMFYKKKDWWGYCNTTGDQFPMTPGSTSHEDVSVAGYGCTTCKIPGFFTMASGMLKKIIYPTGGSTEFSYENNMYLNGGTAGPGEEGPGLRIRKIINDDGNGNKLFKTYKYGSLYNGVENGTGTLLYTPKAADFKSKLRYLSHTNRSDHPFEGFGGYYDLFSYTLDPVGTLAEAYRLPVYYSTVTEYTESASGDNNGKIVYEYSIPEPVFGSSGQLGLTSFKLKDWTGGKLLTRTVYKRNASSNDYEPVQLDNNQYTTLNYVKIPQIRLKRVWFFLNFYRNEYVPRPLEKDYAHLTTNSLFNAGFPFEVIDWPIESAVQQMKKQVSYFYENGVIGSTTETEFFYDNPKHLQPTRTETLSSKTDEKIINETKYAQDFSNIGILTAMQQGIKNLQDRYIIAPIETSRYKSTLTGTSKRLLTSQLLAYNPVKSVPDSVFAIDTPDPLFDFVPAHIVSGNLIKDNRYVKKHVFDSYDDKSNLLKQHRVNGVSHSYIWDYDKFYPIAEVINTDIKDVFYEPFDRVTGPDFSSQNDSRTGIYSTRYGFTKTLTGLTSGKYTLNYWKKETNNKWSLIRIDDINVIDSYTISINPTYQVDDILFYPKDTHVNTYSYAPLVGMTSSTDPNGVAIYYEYDPYWRLKNIKDADGNIIKSYDYHYKP